MSSFGFARKLHLIGLLFIAGYSFVPRGLYDEILPDPLAISAE